MLYFFCACFVFLIIPVLPYISLECVFIPLRKCWGGTSVNSCGWSRNLLSGSCPTQSGFRLRSDLLLRRGSLELSVVPWKHRVLTLSWRCSSWTYRVLRLLDLNLRPSDRNPTVCSSVGSALIGPIVLAPVLPQQLGVSHWAFMRSRDQVKYSGSGPCWLVSMWKWSAEFIVVSPRP